MLNAIVWDIKPYIFQIDSIGYELRYYSLLFAVSFIFGFYLMQKIFQKENIPIKELDRLTIFMIVGTVLGARLGHTFFYEPAYYLSNPLEIFMVWKGGLASHGAAVGILLSLYFYSRKLKEQSFLWVLDRVVITVASAAVLIRLGNLFNSEIYGDVTNLPWGFIFVYAGEKVAKHPTQIYEALCYLIVFVVLFLTYKKYGAKTPRGLLFGYFLIGIFTARFFIEFIKEPQVGFEEQMIINMGQILSLPFIVAGVYFVVKSLKNKEKKTL